MTRRRKPARRRRLALAVVPVTVLSAGAHLFLSAGTAQAEGAVFDAFAQGIGVQATLSNQSLPLGLVIEGIGPEASSRVTSFGQSDAEASFPYTGTVVPGLFGLGPPLLLGLPGIEYPAQAATGAGQPPQDIDFPGVSLHAESGTASNVAEAVVGDAGAGIAGGRSASRIDRDESGNVVSTATAHFDSLKLGGSLTLSNVHSTVWVLADSTTGKLTRKSSFSIGRLTVPGLSVTVPEKSPAQLSLPNPLPGLPQAPPVALPSIPLPMAGQTLPAPEIGFIDGTFTTTLPGFGSQKFAIPAQAVLDGLKAAGVELAYQPAVETATGVQGGVFTAKYTFADLPDNQYFSGPVPVTYNVASAVASVNLTPVGLAPATGAIDAGVDTGVVAAPAPAGVDGASAPDLAGLGTDLGGAVPGEVPATVNLAPAPSAGGQPIAQAGSTSSLPLNSDLNNLYFLLVLLVVGQLVVTTVLRLLGVRR
ncbi:hypothetical protein GCM10009547_35410 [Sporichthya brevicatena]|uniref:Uncharacterized protein n=1 Tax=Sporichthya brevicatena TaxID=171442 RepID=A0ABN1H4L3_9ACTN